MKLSKELGSALDEYTKSKAELARISGLISNDQRRLASIQEEVRSAKNQLAGEEADAALAGGPVENRSRASTLKKLAAFRDEEEAVRARIEGLNARFNAPQTTVLQAAVRLRNAFSLFTKQAITEAEAQFEKTCQRFVEDVRPIVTEMLALGLQVPGLPSLKLPKLFDGSAHAARVLESQYVDNRHVETLPAKYHSVVNDFAPLRGLVLEAERLVEKATADEHAATQAALTKAREANPRPFNAGNQESLEMRRQRDREEGERILEEIRKQQPEFIRTTPFPNNPERRGELEGVVFPAMEEPRNKAS